MAQHSDSLLVSQSEQFVVIHHGIHILDPEGVHVTVEQNVSLLALVFIVQRFVHLSKNFAQQAVCPVARIRIQHAVQLVHGTRLIR